METISLLNPAKTERTITNRYLITTRHIKTKKSTNMMIHSVMLMIVLICFTSFILSLAIFFTMDNTKLIISTILHYCSIDIDSGYSINYHQIRQQWAVFIPHFHQMQMCFLHRYHCYGSIRYILYACHFNLDKSFIIGIYTLNTKCDWSRYNMNSMWVNIIMSIIILFGILYKCYYSVLQI